MSEAHDQELLRGDLSAVALLEALQLVGRDDPVCLELLDEQAGAVFGWVTVHDRRVLDVRVDALSGVEAFVAMMRIAEGPFRVRRVASLVSPTPLDMPLDTLLLQCAEHEDRHTGAASHRTTLVSEVVDKLDGVGTD